MAAFTSTQNGNWNDGGTWGNDSPGVKGTDWPGNAADTFSCGHAVAYNVSETNELGDSTITTGGLLTAITSSGTKISFGDNILTVNNGGEYRVGASGTVIDAAYTAEIIFNTSSDNAKGINVDDGGKLTIYGDPTYYGSDDETTLANDAENTDDDDEIVTTDDMSALWNVGDEIVIRREKLGDTSSYIDAAVKYTIQAIVGTKITLDVNFTGWVAGIGDTWAAPVVNVTRNVKLYKLGVDTVCGDGSSHFNTNRPRIYDINASGNNNCVISNAIISGFYSIDSNFDFQFLSSVIRNGYYGFYQGSNHTISGSIYSLVYGVSGGTSITVSGNIFAAQYGIDYGTGHIVSSNLWCNRFATRYGTGNVFSGDNYGSEWGIRYGNSHLFSGNVFYNRYGIGSGNGHRITGNLYGNTYGLYVGTGCIISSRIGYDSSDVSDPNTTSDIYTDGFSVHTCLNVKMPLAGLNVRRNQDMYTTRVISEHDNRTLNAQKIYDNVGDVVKVACDGGGDRPSEDPDGGGGDCIELSNIQTLCSTSNPLKTWEANQYRLWVTAAGGAVTYTFKVQTTYAGISAGGLKLTATYLDGVSGGSTSEQTNAPAINQRANAADWTQTLAVTVTPQEDGWLDFMIELMEYESGNEVYIWPEVAIT